MDNQPFIPYLDASHPQANNLQQQVFNLEYPGNTSNRLSASGYTVSATSEARMKVYGAANVPQQTRHARRIYIGGIPPNYTDEDGLRNFLNNVISQGLGEENDQSYVLSIYLNHKKCFAFVELKSIELATACLELDGIIFRNIVLHILRANEYKPELVPAHMNKVIRFDLSGFQFGTPNASLHPQYGAEEIMMEKSLSAVMNYSELSNVEPDSLVLLGFPFDDVNRRSDQRGLGCSLAPRSLRNSLKRFKYGSVDNPELGLDLSSLKITDIGDINAGKSYDEARNNLTQVVTELIVKGCIPFIIGGANESSFYATQGILNASMAKVAVVTISSQLDLKILDDPRFCPPLANSYQQSCDGRLVLFGAQGSQCSTSDTQFVKERGGVIYWLGKDLRSRVAEKSVAQQLQDILTKLNQNQEEPIPIVVTLDSGVLSSTLAPLANSNHSPLGLHLEEVTEIARICGSDPNVGVFYLSEFSPDREDSRYNLILADLFYQFAVGIAMRPKTSPRPHYLPSNAKFTSSLNILVDGTACIYQQPSPPAPLPTMGRVSHLSQSGPNPVVHGGNNISIPSNVSSRAVRQSGMSAASFVDDVSPMQSVRSLSRPPSDRMIHPPSPLLHDSTLPLPGSRSGMRLDHGGIPFSATTPYSSGSGGAKALNVPPGVPYHETPYGMVTSSNSNMMGGSNMRLQAMQHLHGASVPSYSTSSSSWYDSGSVSRSLSNRSSSFGPHPSSDINQMTNTGGFVEPGMQPSRYGSTFNDSSAFVSSPPSANAGSRLNTMPGADSSISFSNL